MFDSFTCRRCGRIVRAEYYGEKNGLRYWGLSARDRSPVMIAKEGEYSSLSIESIKCSSLWQGDIPSLVSVSDVGMCKSDMCKKLNIM